MARKSRFGIVVESSTRLFTIYNAGLYCRLSIEDGDSEEQNSIGNQKKIIFDHLKAFDNIKVYDEYADNGFTGMNFERPGFKRMVKDLEDGKINCIIIKDISRLGRNFILTSELAERTLPELGVRLISVNDEYDSICEGADASSLVMPLKMVMNDYYVKDISRKIRSGIDAKIQSGEFLPSSGSIPYGYLRNAEEKTFEVDIETAPVIEEIFLLKEKRYSLNDICKYLNERNIPSPGKLRYIRGLTQNPKYGKAIWGRKTVKKILEDCVYIGCRVHGKVKKDRVGADKKRRNKSEWRILPDAHRPIISKELFEKVQQILKEENDKRLKFDKRTPLDKEEKGLFSGLVFCEECGARMSAYKSCGRKSSARPVWVFFDCNSYRNSAHLQCSSHYINQAVLVKCIKDTLDKQMQLALDVERLLDDIKHRSDLKRYREKVMKCYNNASNKRKKIEAKIEHLITDLTEGLIDRDEYVYMKERYSSEYDAALKAEIAAKVDFAKHDHIVSEAEKWMQTIKEAHCLPMLDRPLVELLVQKITVSKDRSIKLILNYADPYEQLLNYVNEAEEAGKNAS